MKKLLLVVPILLGIQISFSQTPGIQWQRNLGGSSTDRGYAAFHTIDSGFLFINETNSNDSDVISNHGGNDIWIVKTNRSGIIEWKKCFGGTATESFKQAFYHGDGTTTIISHSNSNNGDVPGNHGGVDLWVFKIDATGNLIWQISLGGSGAEEFRSADVLTDNSVIIAAYTPSNDGDVSGNHGSEDIWLVKLTTAGAIQWQKCLGGTSSDRPRYVHAMSDGNYLIVGSTASADGDVTSNHGSNDVWVVKLNTSGTIIWQKTYGGTSSDVGFKAAIANSSDIAILANTSSNNGDVSGFHGVSFSDIWVFSVAYSDGSLQWQKCIGGSASDQASEIMTVATNSYLISGVTMSAEGDASTNHSPGFNDIFLAKINGSGVISWTKCFGGTRTENLNVTLNDTLSNEYTIIGSTNSSDGDIHGYHNSLLDSTTDAWVVKIDSAGIIKWQKCLGGIGYEYVYGATKMAGDEYILAGESSSNNSGDVQDNNGSIDSWVIRLGATNTIKGTVFYDRNSNGTKDSGEPYYSNVTVNTQKGSTIKSLIPSAGSFSFDIDTGSYTTSVQLHLPYFTVVPASHNNSFTNYFNTDSFSFALQPIAGMRDLVTNMWPTTTARIGFDLTYKIFYQNDGTDTVANGQVLFKKDSRLTFLSSVPTISSSSGDTLKWDFSSFKPLDTATITVNMHVPSTPTVNIGDTLTSLAIIIPILSDQTPSDDSSIVKQIASGAFDPNDKYEDNEGKITSTFMSSGKYLNYLVRFQNIGTDTAFNVVVRDTLDSKLDLTTLQMITSSHFYSLGISGRVLTWTFYNIQLPYSSINSAGSQGFIRFRIKPDNNLLSGDTIHNTASIYFDFNLPVKTNDAYTVVQDLTSPLPLNFLSFTGVYQNNHGILNWSTTNEINVASFRIERSSDGIHFNIVGSRIASGLPGINSYQFNDNLSTVSGDVFYYRLNEIDFDGKEKYSRTILLRRNSLPRPMVYPNPASNNLNLLISSKSQQLISIDIFDATGKVVLRQRENIFEGNNSVQIENIVQLKPGVYILAVETEDNSANILFIKK